MSQSIRALRFADKERVSVVDAQVPDPGPGEILLDVKAAGLCGSDLHYFHMTHEEMQHATQPRSPEMTPGHEIAGVVLSVGPGVNYPAVGDRVAVQHYSGCGSCETCRKGWDVHCEQASVYSLNRPGGCQDKLVVTAKDAVVLPESVSFAAGAFLACGATTAYQALKRSEVSPGGTVLVIGAGPVGLAVLTWARSLGLNAIATDPSPERRRFAKEIGFGDVYDSADFDILRWHSDKADVVIETSGNIHGRRAALAGVKTWGTVVFVGLGPGFELDPVPDLIMRQITLRGMFVFSVPLMMEAVREAAIRQVHLDPIITRVAGIEDGPAAFSDFANGSVGKTVIGWA
ncbi:zinc-dependent alcohol dehydrogenase family protein [Paenarthrobacter aromaticivorans]|uniref:Zinc-binding dehydrogenase n=1 Tax=Paenarthrobacter aromaticivorans TaxID=2849150 RepID=A0ABS6HZ76_9MICC|nr:zinc-binding dehydrogenase [Paenarthrobacter sp. MMS21-TAE1-1]MBU8864800.1 zinc-binding dehydrogenase [Paenarthrobacter sp. MMS21-TAE1-1]